jgi:hypothetical protein
VLVESQASNKLATDALALDEVDKQLFVFDKLVQ